MPAAQRSITINRPIAEVFDFIADGENGPKWRAAGIEVRHQSGSGVGAVYQQTVPGPLRRRVRADYEVTAYEPPRRVAFRAIAGPVRPTGEYQLQTIGDGTRVTFELDARLPLLKRLLMGRSVKRSIDAELRALDKLKSVLERHGDRQSAASGGTKTGTTKAGAAAKPAAKPEAGKSKATDKPRGAKPAAAKATSRARSTKPAAKSADKPAPKATSRRSATKK